MNFPRPNFATPDALASETELQAKYSELTGKSLFPAQPETLLSNWAAYLKTVTDTLIQYTGEQNLVNFAQGVNLDRLGDLWDAPRLSPQKSLTTLEFTLSEVRGSNYLIPQGTLVRSVDQKIIFETTNNLTIFAGQLSGQITAQSTTTGEQGNGYAIGQISELVNPLPEITVTNITITNGGSDTESDSNYRQRLLLAPNKLNTAGSRDSYKFFALTADPTISSVSVISPNEEERLTRAMAVTEEITQQIKDKLTELEIDNDLLTEEEIYNIIRPHIYFPRYFVEVFILVNKQLPTPEIIEKVQNLLDNSEIRPLTDIVKVSAPFVISQNITVQITATINTNLSDLNNQLNQILDDYIEEITSTMGIDIVPSQIIQRLQIPGVYEVKVITPSAPVIIRQNEIAVVPTHNLIITGVKEL